MFSTNTVKGVNIKASTSKEGKSEASKSQQSLATAEGTRRGKARANLLHFANESRLAGYYNDVTVGVGKDRFPANKMVLASASDYFKNFFEKSKCAKFLDHVEVEGVDKASMEALIEFIYTENMKVTHENVKDILSAANLLEIKDAKDYCFEFLAEEIATDNCFDVLEIADETRNETLKAKAVQFIGESVQAVTTTETNKPISGPKRTFEKESSSHQSLTWTNITQMSGSSKTSNLDTRKFIDDAHKVAKAKLQEEDSGTRILILGGKQESQTKSGVTEIYNCTGEPPALYPDLPGDGRFKGRAVVLNGCVYYVGGMEKTNTEVRLALKSLLCLKLGGKFLAWRPKEVMSTNRHSMGAAAFKGKLVVSGGISSRREAMSSVESYSPSQYMWEHISPLKEARFGHGMVGCKDRLYTIGGEGYDGQPLSSVERLRADGDGWEYMTSMQSARSGFAAVCYNDSIYAIGGMNGEGTLLNTSEKYDPEIDKWSYMEPMQFNRHGCSACVLLGRIYVVGGVDEEDNDVKQIECYDPATGEWKIVKEIENLPRLYSIAAV